LLERLGDLLVAQFLVTPQNHCQALRFRQIGNGGVDRLLQFLFEERSIRRDRVFVPDRPFLLLRFTLEWHLRMARTAAQFVKHQIASDLKQPGRELRPRHIALRTFPDPHENLLSNVFGVGSVPQHPGHRADHQPLMTLHELLEGAGVARADQSHQANILGILLGSCRRAWVIVGHLVYRRCGWVKVAEGWDVEDSTFIRRFRLQQKGSMCIMVRNLARLMNLSLIPTDLRPIAEKVESGQRISEADALSLYRSNDLNALGILASVVRERKNGNVATYILNRYVNYSNLCILSCQFCAFAAKKRDAHAFERSIDDIVGVVEESLASGITEVHMVGGLHPTLKKEWYLDLLQRLRALDPNLIIKAFTAIEVRHLAQRIFKLSIPDTLATLRNAGLGALTGGGAEIFDAGVRDELCRGKESAAEWLDVHRIWHQMGGRSTSTMLYGHIETLEQRVDHLRQLRELQDETGGFTGFVPFAFEPQTTILAHVKPATAVEQLRNLAVSRIYLDNFDHLTAYWVSMGLPLAQISLSYGVDDLHGTIMEEKIFHMAGAKTPQEQTVETLEHVIREAGRDPIQRDSFYRHLPRKRPAAAPAPPAVESELVCA